MHSVYPKYSSGTMNTSNVLTRCSILLCTVLSAINLMHQRIFNSSSTCKRSSIRGGAYKFLAPLTSQCHRTESIVSLERGVCSCAELQVFSCYRGRKEACKVTHAISTTWRRELSSSFFPCKARHGRKFTPF